MAIHRITAFVISLFAIVAAVAQTTPTVQDIIDLGLPTVIINTIGGEEPTCDHIEAPEGCMGVGRINDKPVYGSMVIRQHDNTLYSSGDYQKDVSGIMLRITGNTTSMPNQLTPYKIKLQKEADLLGRDPEIYSDKEWRLINCVDRVYNIAGWHLSETIGMDWTPQHKHCNLIINGTFRGVYTLIETVKRNPTCRINIKKKEGYIIERDLYWWNEDLYFGTPFYELDRAYRWTFKYPDEKDIDEEDMAYITDYVTQAEATIFNDEGPLSYEDFFDVESMARWLMAHDILGTRDSGGSNLFITKYDRQPDSRLVLPTIWDLDTSFKVSAASFCSMHNSGHGYFRVLFNHSNRAFANAYCRLWQQVVDRGLMEELQDFLRQFGKTEEGRAIEKSRILFRQIEHIDYKNTFDEDIEETCNWLEEHKEWMDTEIQKIPMGVTTPYQPAAPDAIYDLQGKRVGESSTIHALPHGIYIRNGKKIVR